MNITRTTRQFKQNDDTYRSLYSSNSSTKTIPGAADALEKTSGRASDRFTSDQALPDSISDQASDNSASRTKSSVTDDSVGQLAVELAHAETRMDVMQVMGKATKALIKLKMSVCTDDEKEAKKISKQINRMEKLIKRIQKKIRQLGKEEELELRQRRAEKKKEMEAAKEIRENLRSRRKRRHRDEQKYAEKELAEDGRESSGNLLSAVLGADAALSVPQTAIYNAAGGLDLSAVTVAGGAIDLSV